eukprot:871297-Amphidinium_carterae.1
MRAVENNVLKVLYFFTASDANVANLEGRVRTFLMPHTPKSSIKGSFSVLCLTLPIKLMLPVGRGREAESQALEV